MFILMYIICKKWTTNLKLIDSLIVSHETSIRLWRALLTDVTAESGSCWIETDWLCAISNGRISVKCCYIILIHVYKFRTTNKTVLPLHILISQNPWKPFAEPSLRNAGVDVMDMDEGYIISCNFGNMISLYVLLLYFYREFNRE